MRAVPTTLPGVVIIEPDVHQDPRGFFLETYHARNTGRSASPARSCRTTTRDRSRGTLRGLHLQLRHAAGQADSRHRGRDLRRRRRRAPRFADVRPVGRRHALGRELPAVLHAAGLCARLLRRQPGGAGRIQVHGHLRPEERARHRLERSGPRDLLAHRRPILSDRDHATCPSPRSRAAPAFSADTDL